MLSLRLKKISSLISKEDNVIDIGCDHGYLSIDLAQKGCQVIASDINQNALNNAINNIKKYNLNAKIKTILSDGLKNINPIGYNTIVISGMGTTTILNILNEKDKLKDINKIIIQSNNHLYELRKEMINRGYYIKQESTVCDDNIFYVIIEFQKGSKKYQEMDYKYGPILKQNKENKAYFEYLLNRNINILNNIPKNKIILRKNMQNEIRIIKKILEFSVNH